MTALCAPRELYRCKRVRVTDSGGSYTIIDRPAFYTKEAMDRRYPGWDTTTTGGAPTCLVVGRPDWALYPYPNWTLASAVRLYGFAIPGDDWAGTGVMARTDPFPMAQYCIEAVVYRAALIRSVQFPTKDNLSRQGSPIPTT